MYLEIKRQNDFSKINEEFNEFTRPLTELIFNPNKIVFPYFLSTSNNFNNKRQKILDPLISRINYIDIPSSDINRQGILEEILETIIDNHDYSLLILTGASGSGKTSLISYVKESLARKNCSEDNNCIRYVICKRKRKIILYFDFLSSDANASTQDIVSNYEFKLNGFLLKAVLKCLEDKPIFSDFFNHLADSDDTTLIQLYILLKSSENISSISDVVSKINNSSETYPVKNDYLSAILKYHRELYPQFPRGCFTLIFDNIDKFKDEDQSIIIKKIVTLHNRIKCNIVITSRLTTFYKLHDNFSNIIAVLENAGPTPVDILNFRLKYYLENRNTLKDIIDIRTSINNIEKRIHPDQSKTFVEYYDQILTTLSKYLDPLDDALGLNIDELNKINFQKNLIQSTLSAYSGLSVRRCLALSTRFIKPIVYKYSDVPTANQLLTSLSYTCSRGLQFNDTFITNIFGRSDDNRRNSWLLYRILNVLKISHDNKLDISVYQLFEVINLFDDVIEEDFVFAINILVDPQKRLAYISGYSELIAINRQTNSKVQKIHITKSGIEYFLFLATNINYLQNCFSALDWKSMGFYLSKDKALEIFKEMLTHCKDLVCINSTEIQFLMNDLTNHFNDLDKTNKSLEFNEGDISDRMHFVRLSLEVMLFHDIFESFLYNKRKDEKKHIENINMITPYHQEINSFPTLRLAKSLGETFMRIVNSYVKKGNKMDFCFNELHAWHTLLIKIDLWHKLIFKVNYSNVDTLNFEIESLIFTINK